MKKLLLLSLVTSFAINGFSQAPNQFNQPLVPKEPISEKDFKEALDLISYAEGYRTAQTVKNLPKERINSVLFFKGFKEAQSDKIYTPDAQALQKAQQTLYFYQTQKQEAEAKKTKVVIDAFKNNKNKIKLENGIQYITTKKGTGEQVKSGDNITLHYKGLLTNGQVFDNSYERQEPIPLKVEEGQVISGWIKLLPLLKVGQVIETLIPAALAYGDVATGPIPANADLFFILEVVSKEAPTPIAEQK